MQICVFPVFTFPRIVNKTDVVFMVSIVIVCSYYHCSVQVGPAQCPLPTICFVGIIQHDEGGFGFGHHSHGR